MPELNDVSRVDGYVRVDVCRVDPLTGEVLGQEAGRLLYLGSYGGQFHTFRGLE